MRLSLSSAALSLLVLCCSGTISTTNAFQRPTTAEAPHGAAVFRSRSPMLMTASMIDSAISGGEDSSSSDGSDAMNKNKNKQKSSVKSSSSSSSSSKQKTKSQIVDWNWKQLASDAFADDVRPIILFDGVCNLCDAGINFAMDQDESAKFRFCSIQSKVAQSLILRSGKSLEDKANIMLITKEEAYVSSDAVSRICMELDAAPLKWLGHMGQFTPTWVRESIYQFVSNNRYKFGENDSCRLDFDGTYTNRFLSDPLDDL